MSKHTPGPWNKGKGKGYVNQRGYRVRKINGREVKEHRLVMEQHLGRKLEPWEHVHHKDGDKVNNTIANLELITAEEHNREHAGKQRSDSAKRTMAIYREMRMEIDHLRSLNSEMLEALKLIEAEVRAYGELYTPGGASDKKWQRALKAAQDAIAKATGGDNAK